MPEQDAAVELTHEERGSEKANAIPVNGHGPAPADPARLEHVLDESGLLDHARFEQFERELIAAERWEDLAALYELGSQRTGDPDIGRNLMINAGLLELEKLGDLAAAEAHLRRVLASDSGNIDALDAYRTLCVELGRFDEAADLLDLAIQA